MTEYREKVVVSEESAQPTVLLGRLVFLITDVVEVFLATRFFLKAIQADPGGGLVDLVYRLSDPLVAPFRGIFPPAAAAGIIIEWATLLTMLVIVLVAMMVVRLLRLSAT